jgi:hypothetical protein
VCGSQSWSGRCGGVKDVSTSGESNTDFLVMYPVA